MINFETFFKISYGLYIVSAGNDDKSNGFISNSVFQVTSDPPQFAVCCNKENFTAEYIESEQAFSISVLRQDVPATLIGKFGYKSGKDINKFEGSNYWTGITGVPIYVEECVAFIECRLVQTVDVGTHLMFIGEAVQADILNGEEAPLTYEYYRTVKKGIAPKNAPTYIDKKNLAPQELDPGKAKYRCQVCGHIYDPEEGDPDGGIAPGTAFDDIPDDWVCPVCGSRKSDFVKIGN